MDINADIQTALGDWDRFQFRGVWYGCRYEEEYSDEIGIQGVSRTIIIPAMLLDILGQGDTLDRVCTIDERLIGPFTVETVERDTDATVRLRLRSS